MEATNAVSRGLIVMHAMDLYTQKHAPPNAGPPPPPPGGGTIVAWLMGDDTILPGHPNYRNGPLKTFDSQVCYGYVARKGTERVVAIRGTNGIAEWIEDAEFAPKTWPRDPTCQVEEGFWGIYDTFALIGMNHAPPGKPADALPGLMAGATSVLVTGHGPGAPLAIYLSFDLNSVPALTGRVRGCYFACPHPGDQPFATRFGAAVADHVVYNHVLDVVPRVPAFLGHCSLPNVQYLQPATAKANIHFDLGCNHHIVCYRAMLDYDTTMPLITPPPAGEETCVACIRGKPDATGSLALSLAARIAGQFPR